MDAGPETKGPKTESVYDMTLSFLFGKSVHLNQSFYLMYSEGLHFKAQIKEKQRIHGASLDTS